MSSKGWKLLVVAPLAMTLLSACGGRDKKDNSYRSPYAGSWLTKVAANDYFEGARAGGNAFCELVGQHPGLHGYKRVEQQQVLRMTAWQIYPDGRVFRWGRSLTTTNVSSMRGIGVIDRSGYMRPYASSTVSQMSQEQIWTFNRLDNTLSIGLPGARNYVEFLPLSDWQMQDYALRLERCMGMRIEDRTFSSYGVEGPLPMDQFDGAMVPPGAAFGPGPGPQAGPGPYDEQLEDPNLDPNQQQTPRPPPRNRNQVLK